MFILTNHFFYMKIYIIIIISMDQTYEDMKRKSQEFIDHYGIIPEDEIVDDDFKTETMHNLTKESNLKKRRRLDTGIDNIMYVMEYDNVKNTTKSYDRDIIIIQVILCVMMLVEIMHV